jgi:hypothetical protein
MFAFSLALTLPATPNRPALRVPAAAAGGAASAERVHRGSAAKPRPTPR